MPRGKAGNRQSALSHRLAYRHLPIAFLLLPFAFALAYRQLPIANRVVKIAKIYRSETGTTISPEAGSR